MLYIRSEYEKKSDKGSQIFVPLYMIHCLNKYECGGEPSKISSVLSSERAINDLVKLYKMTFTGYFDLWTKKNSGSSYTSYNSMIKS